MITSVWCGVQCVHGQWPCAAPASLVELGFPLGLAPLFMRTTVHPFSFGVKSNMGCRTASHSVMLITSEYTHTHSMSISCTLHS